MTIRNMESYRSSIWDWGILKGYFPNTRIEPTDIDGFVEFGGHFLVLETKRSGVPVPRGQEIMFEAFRRTGLFTVIVIWGEANNPESLRVIKQTEDRMFEKASLVLLRAVVAEWFMSAWRHRNRGQR